MRSKRSSPRQKRRNCTPLLIFFFLLPYIAGFAPDSTGGSLEFMAGAGAGQYAYRDCSGMHTRPFNDGGFSVTKKFVGPYRLGLAVGAWNSGDQGTGAFAFPDLALDWETFSIGTTGVRIGSVKTFYAEARWLDQTPFWSGKGALRAGIGGPLNDHGSRLWFGTNFIPYSNLGVAMQLDVPVTKGSSLFVNGRLGNEMGVNEFGVSLGMRYFGY